MKTIQSQSQLEEYLKKRDKERKRVLMDILIKVYDRETELHEAHMAIVNLFEEL
jgi:hypothetical protein